MVEAGKCFSPHYQIIRPPPYTGGQPPLKIAIVLPFSALVIETVKTALSMDVSGFCTLHYYLVACLSVR